MTNKPLPEWLVAMRADAYRKMLDDEAIARLTAIDACWKLFRHYYQHNALREAFQIETAVAVLVANQSMLIYHYAHGLIDHNMSGLMPERARRKLWLDVQNTAERFQHLHEDDEPCEQCDNAVLIPQSLVNVMVEIAGTDDTRPAAPQQFPADTYTLPGSCDQCQAHRELADLRCMSCGSDPSHLCADCTFTVLETSEHHAHTLTIRTKAGDHRLLSIAGWRT